MNGKRLLLLAVAMAVLVALCVYTIDSMIRVGDEGEMRTVEDAVRHAALTCFAVEGAYPSELSYLQEH